MAQTTQRPGLKGSDPYLAQFSRFETGKDQPGWLLPLRKAGLARFAELKFPTIKDEDWRFTNVAPIAKLPFRPLFEPGADGVSGEKLNQLPLSALPGPRLVFVNGHYAAGISSVGPLPHGVKVSNLAGALASEPDLVEEHLGQYAVTATEAFTALNQAFFLDGGFVYVPSGQAVAEPIQIIHVSTARQSGATVQPRNLIIVEPRSQATVIENYLTVGGAGYFTNAVTEIMAGDDATVEYLKFQDEAPDAFHVAAIHGRFSRASRVNVHSFSLGARLSRNNIRAELAGEGLECILNGLYLTKDEQLADHFMIVEHAQPRCASHEYFNGILDGKSRGVFHGRILVRPLAQKTDAKQTNKNLLLSDDATADTKPQLEIYADDVKCTHGATIGQLNEEAIFYLRSRGIGTDTARSMLIHAFAGEIIERIRCQTVRDALDKLVWDYLEANPRLAPS